MNIHDPSLDPDNLSQKEKIELIRESDGILIDLLEGEEIKNGLDLSHLSSLTHLPEGLKVSGSLDLWNCASLTHLSEGLEVGRNLYLESCPAKIHSTIKVRGRIYK